MRTPCLKIYVLEDIGVHTPVDIAHLTMCAEARVCVGYCLYPSRVLIKSGKELACWFKEQREGLLRKSVMNRPHPSTEEQLLCVTGYARMYKAITVYTP